jgi:hypothetical protein
MIQAKYKDIRSILRPGDAFVFIGKDNFVSDAIEVYTGGLEAMLKRQKVPSHFATVFRGMVGGDLRVFLIESTTDAVAFDPAWPRTGVQISLASERLSYQGAVHALTLDDMHRAEFDEDTFNKFCLAHQGDPYDKGDIAAMALDPAGIFNRKDSYQSFICSQLGAAWEKSEGFLSATVNTKTVTPADQVQFKLWKEDYQLTGDPAELYKFNTVDPLSWKGHGI